MGRHRQQPPRRMHAHVRVETPDPGAYRGPAVYRSRHGMIFGVCRGLAHSFGFNTAGVRILAVFALIFTGFWPVVIAYVVAALVMKPEPVLPLQSEDDAEFYNSFTGSRTMALHRLKRTYENLDRRIQRMESIVTSRGYDWDSRLENGR